LETPDLLTAHSCDHPPGSHDKWNTSLDALEPMVTLECPLIKASKAYFKSIEPGILVANDFPWGF